MLSARVIRGDGEAGQVVEQITSVEGAPRWVVAFADGTRLAVPPELLLARTDGAYDLALDATAIAGSPEDDQYVIPVIAEELQIDKVLVERRKVRIHKRVETRDELIDEPTIREEVVVDRQVINTIITGEAPVARYEEGVLVIPILEEIVVVEKRLLLREEVRVSKRKYPLSNPQRVTLRREVVEIEEVTPDEPEAPGIG